MKIRAKEVILVHFQTYISQHFYKWIPSLAIFKYFAFQNTYFLDFFWMIASKTSYAAYLKKLLIRVSDETCLMKNWNVNLFLTHICLDSWEFFIS